jgi:hypothetical protein
VLTGVTDPVGLVRAPAARRPTYVGSDLRALRDSADAVTVQAGLARCGRASAAVEGGQMVVRFSRGHDTTAKLDVLRAVCGAAWAVGDPVTVAGVETVLSEAGWTVRPSTQGPY